jgi:hypothetical protein
MNSNPFPSTPAANELPTPPRALLRGTQVERFEILRVIADAASNIEYVALDQTERTEVVLKEYMPQRLGRRKGDALRPLTPAAATALAAGLRSFIDEGRMLASIDHPALVRVLGMIEANGSAYMVMPLYDGLRLQHARQAMSVPPDERLLRPLIEGLLSALEAMHARDVVHGAVGPGNILLLSDERAVLLGPDLARLVIADDLVESLMTAVEPSFEAPEQLAPSPSRPLGPWTDLYSLAETIRFCISGELRPPHVAPGGQREPMARMVQRLFGDPPTAVYSAALLEALDATLDPQPALRPQSVGRFRELLGPWSAEATPAHTDAPILRAASEPLAPLLAEPHGGRVEPAFDLDRTRVALAPATPSAKARTARATESPQGRFWVLAAAVVTVGAVAGVWGGGWMGRGNGGWHASGPMPTAMTEPSPAPAPTASSASTPATPEDAAPALTPPAPPTSARAPVAASAVTAPAPARPPVTPPAIAPTAPPRAASPGLASPRDACEGRTQFALYHCMQLQCEQRVWLHHPQCELLRQTDTVE